MYYIQGAMCNIINNRISPLDVVALCGIYTTTNQLPAVVDGRRVFEVLLSLHE